MTNDRKHRKKCPGGDSWQSREDSRGEPLFDGRSLPDTGKKLGARTRVLDGVKGGGMRGRKHEFKSGESLSGSAGCAADKERYKPSGESRTHARQEVGDGHSTADVRDNTTLAEERAISLDTPCPAGRARVNAVPATLTPNRTRVLWDRLYVSAKSQPERGYGNLFGLLTVTELLHGRRSNANI